MRYLKEISLIGCVAGGLALILRGDHTAGAALIIIGLEEAWRNGKTAKKQESEEDR